jgi:hypothetical protein
VADEDVLIRIAADVKEALNALNDIRSGMGGIRQPAEEAAGSLENLFLRMTGAVTVGDLLAHAIESMAEKLFDFGKGALEAGARLQQLSGVAEYLGNRAGYSTAYIKDLADQMQRTGITGQDATNAIIQLTRYNFDLNDALKLQAAAQNSASIAGKSSSETLGLLIRGITTLQPQLLESAGFTVSLQQAENEYAKANGISAQSIDVRTKQQILMNKVLEQGKDLEGVYALSMDYSAKIMTSLDRVMIQIEERLGTALNPLFEVAVKLMYDWAQNVRDVDLSALNSAMVELANFITRVVTEMSKPDGLLHALGQLGSTAGRDAVDATETIGKSIEDLLVSLHLMKEGQDITFTQFWIDKIHSTTTDVNNLKYALDKVADWMRWAHENGGLIGYALGKDPDIKFLSAMWDNFWHGGTVVLPTVKSAFDDLRGKGVEPVMSATDALKLSTGDMSAAYRTLQQQSEGYVKGGGLPVVEAHKQTAAEAKKAAEEAKKYAAALVDVTRGAESSFNIQEQLNGSVVEAIRYYIQHGASVKDLAIVYKAAEQQVKAVKDQMEFEQAATRDTTKAFGDHQAQLIPLIARYGSLHETITGVEDDINDVADQWLHHLHSTTIAGEGLQTLKGDYLNLGPPVDSLRKNLKAVRDDMEKPPPSVLKEYSDIFGKIAGEFQQMSQISGGTFGAIAKDIGIAFSAGKQLADVIKLTSDIMNPENDKGGWSAANLTAVAAGWIGVATAIYSVVSSLIAAHEAAKKEEAEMALAAHISADFSTVLSDSLTKNIEQSIASLDKMAGAMQSLYNYFKANNVGDFGAKSSAEFTRMAAEALNLNAVIQSMGGILHLTADQATDVRARMDLLFALMREQGPLGQQAIKQVDEVLTAMGTDMTKSGGLVSQFFLDMVTKAKASGAELDNLKKFLQGQMMSAMTGLTTFLDNATVSTNTNAHAMGGAVAAVFGQLTAGGMSISEALKALQDPITKLQAQLAKAGFDGGAAFNQIAAFAAIASDKIAGPAIAAVSGLNDLMKGLHNSGLLDQDTFAGLASQVTDTFQKLQKQGYDGRQIMLLMQPTLQTLWQMEKDFGLKVDDATQSLINQGVDAGIVGDKHRSAQELMQNALDKTAKAVEFLAKVFGYVPPAADEAASRTDAAMGGVAGVLNGQVAPAVENVRARFDGVGGAAEAAAGRARNTTSTWNEWSGRVQGDIGDVKRAVDGVSFGFSPGGLKEWAPMLRDAMAHFRQFRTVAMDAMAGAGGAVDGFGLAGKLSVGAGAITGAGGGSVVVHVDAREGVWDTEASVDRFALRIGNSIADQHYRGTKVATTRAS